MNTPSTKENNYNYDDLKYCYSTLEILKDCDKKGFELAHSFFHDGKKVDYIIRVLCKFKVIESYSDIWTDFVSDSIVHQLRNTKDYNLFSRYSNDVFLIRKDISSNIKLNDFYSKNNELAKLIIKNTQNCIQASYLEEALNYIDSESEPFLKYLAKPEEGFNIGGDEINSFGLTENSFVIIDSFIKKQKTEHLVNSLDKELTPNTIINKKMKV